MNLLDALRQAEQQGKDKVRRGAEAIHNLETSIRRKVTGQTSSSSAYPDTEQDRESASVSKTRTGIVSVNGQDVGKMRCTGGRRTG